MICTTYFLTFFSELIPPTGYIVFLFKADDIMKGYIICLFMFRPLYIEIYYLCGVASSWYIIFFEKVNGLFIPSL